MEKVIALGCNPGGLSVIRSFGTKGIHVIAMTHNRADCGTASRYASEVAWCPDPQDTEALANYLVENEQWHGAYICETGDYFAVALSEHKARLSQYYTIATAEYSMLRNFIEKAETYTRAAECGVPHPRTVEPKTMEELAQYEGELQFPCIIKPVLSHEFVAYFKTKAFIVEDFAELSERFAQVLEAKQPVVVQEIIPGGEHLLERVQMYINSKGEAAFEFFNNKVRQSPPKFGVMRVGVATDQNPVVQEQAKRLMAHVGYQGYCSVEFKRDLRDNKLKLIEVNARLPRNVGLSIGAGIDVPWIIYNDLVKDNQIHVDDYKRVYWIEELTDIVNLIVRDDKSEFKLGEFLKPYFSPHVFGVLWLRDPAPFFKQFGQLFGRFGRERERRRQTKQA